MRTWVQDMQYAVRQFLKAPGFTLSAILSLMLGIGATTAIFSVVYGILLDPYPYKNNDRMVHVELNERMGTAPCSSSMARRLRICARCRQSKISSCKTARPKV